MYLLIIRHQTSVQLLTFLVEAPYTWSEEEEDMSVDAKQRDLRLLFY